MKLSGYAITMGVGAVAGAVAAMMLPQKCTVRKLANKAACTVEEAAYSVKEKIDDKLGM